MFGLTASAGSASVRGRKSGRNYQSRVSRLIDGIEPLESRVLLSVGTLVGKTQSVSFNVGPIVADVGRNIAYVADISDQRVIAVDTSTGNTAAVISLAANATGMAVSPDDARLYVAESTADQIEVVSLLNYSLLKTLPVGVPVSGLAGLANTRVACMTNSGIDIIDGNSGTSLYSLQSDYGGEIKSSLDGTILYSRQRGLSGGAGDVHRWNVSGTGSPVTMTDIPGPSANSTDYTVDPIANRAYLSDGGVYGLTEVNIATGVQTYWPFNTGPYGYGVAEWPGSQYVYGLSYGTVEQFNQNGVVLDAYSFSPIAVSDSLVVTPNGNLMFASDGALSIIGVSNLSIVTTPSSHLVFQVQPTSTTAGKAISPAVVVDIENAQNQIVTADNSTVTLSVNSGPETMRVQVQAKNGVATFSGDLVLTKVGSYALMAADGSDTPAVSNAFTVSAAAATTSSHVVWQVQPTSTTAGRAISPAVVVDIENAQNQIVTTDNSTVTLSVNSGPETMRVQVQAKNGVATFRGDLVLTKVGSYALMAADGSDTPAVSNAFTVSAAAATNLVFAMPPANSQAGAFMPQAVVVDALDTYGNVATTAGGTVSLSVASGPGPIYGLTSVNLMNGVATFNDVWFRTVGAYTLRAEASGMNSATSGILSVTSAAPFQLTFSVVPTKAARRKVFTVQVIAEDFFGNVVTSQNGGTVSLTLAKHPVGGVLTGTHKVSFVNGVATFRDLSLKPSGWYRLMASDNLGLKPIKSKLIAVR